MRGDYSIPHFVESPGFVLTGILLQEIVRDEVALAWRRWGSTLALSRSIQPGHFYGIIANIDSTTGRFDYGAAVVADSFLPTPEGFTRWEVPAKTYGVLTTSLSAYQEARDFFYHFWLPGSGYQSDYGYELEHFSPYFDDETGRPMELWIPLVKTSSNGQLEGAS